MKTKIILLTASLGLVAAPGVWAQTTIYDNLSYATSAGASVWGSGSTTGMMADSFSTLSTDSSLTTVDLLLRRYASSETGSTTIGLYADNSTSPGTLLAVLGTINDTTLSYGSYTEYSYNSTFSLASDTRYWIGITAPTADIVSWAEANDASGVGTSGEYFYWNSPPVAPNSEGPFGLSVSVTPEATPEPSTLALASLGGLGILWQLRRRK